MSIRIRALATKPIGELGPEDLGHAICAKLPRIAPLYGEEDHEGALAHIRVDGGKIAYREEGEPIPYRRLVEPREVADAVKALQVTLEESDEDGVDEVREALDHVTEIVVMELSFSDCEGLGWPVALAAAAAFAERGKGLIQADGEGWLKPRGKGIEHVLDGD